MLRDFSLRDFGASLNTVESHTNESSQGKIRLYEAVNKQKCTHLGMFLASAESIPIIQKVIDSLSNETNSDYWTATEGNAKRALYGLLSFAKMRPDGVWDGD